MSKKIEWDKSLVQEFWKAFDNLDYKTMQDKFGAPDPKKPELYGDWLKATGKDVFTHHINNAEYVRIVHEFKEDSMDYYEITVNVDGRFSSAIDDVAHHIKALVKNKLQPK